MMGNLNVPFDCEHTFTPLDDAQLERLRAILSA